ncbi:MAG: hypothetical protein JXQ73_16500 [Phycisphaerae bacterium]|nr:hypothetical protein [Phycisphaerae bacterium]
MCSRSVLRVILAAVGLAGSIGCVQTTPFEFTPDRLLPKAVHSHPWMPAGEPKRYDSSTLEDYIDGAARPYLEYGMTDLIHAIYMHKSRPERRMVVDVYEMASPLAAYGIYSTLRPEGVEGVDLGTSGFWSEGLLCFVKNRVFVTIQPPGDGPRDYASAMLLGGFVDSRIKLPSSPPAMVDAFPDEDRVSHSIKYLAANMLGYRFLGGGWQATYTYRGVEHGLFAIPCATPSEAIERFEKLAQQIGKNGEPARKITGLGRAAMVGRIDTVGRVYVMCSGKYLVGTVDCFDDDRSAAMCKHVIENVTRVGL